MDLKTLTVRELIDRLQEEDPDMPVVFTADYGDRGHTEQAIPIRGRIEETGLSRTAYSDSGYKLDDENDEHTILVIR